MTGGQKVIKYFAIGFGIFLVVTIFSAIIFGFKIIYSVLTTKNKINDEFRSLETTENINSFRIDLSSSNLIIKNGQEFKVETNNDNVVATEKDGKLTIKEKKRFFFFDNTLSEVVLYLPENVYENVVIETGAGKVEISSLRTNNLKLNLGAGQVILDDIIVNNETKIDGGAGELNISDVSFYNLDLDLGVGKFKFDGDILGKSDISAGVGEVNLNLFSDNYKIKVNKGIGTVKVNDQELHDNEIYGSGDNILKVDGGVGSIKITINNVKEEPIQDELVKTYKLISIVETAKKNQYYLTLQDEQKVVETVLVDDLEQKLTVNKSYEFKFAKIKENFGNSIKEVFENCKIVLITEIK